MKNREVQKKKMKNRATTAPPGSIQQPPAPRPHKAITSTNPRTTQSISTAFLLSSCYSLAFSSRQLYCVHCRINETYNNRHIFLSFISMHIIASEKKRQKQRLHHAQTRPRLHQHHQDNQIWISATAPPASPSLDALCLHHADTHPEARAQEATPLLPSTTPAAAAHCAQLRGVWERATTTPGCSSLATPSSPTSGTT